VLVAQRLLLPARQWDQALAVWLPGAASLAAPALWARQFFPAHSAVVCAKPGAAAPPVDAEQIPRAWQTALALLRTDPSRVPRT
jgi:hypothetical protein